MSAPYYRMFPREWDDGTACLTLEQEGALLRICNTINSRGQCIPDTEESDREMMHRCRVSMRKWKALKAALVAAGKITIRDGKIYQARALLEIAYRAEIAENGAKGGRKRAENIAKTSRKPAENEAGEIKNKGLSQANQNQNQNQTPSNEGETRKRATRLPEIWTPPKEWIDEAVSRGLTRDEAYDQAERMRDWSRSAKAGAKLDWLAAWRNWIKRHGDDRKSKPAGNYADSQRAAADTSQRAALRVIERRMGGGQDHPDGQPYFDARPYRDDDDPGQPGNVIGMDRTPRRALSPPAKE